LDDEHDHIALNVGALYQISGRVDEVWNVDSGERICAYDLETIAESRSF
jgi:hypothetical protein